MSAGSAPGSSDPGALATRLAAVQEGVASAISDAGRNAADVTLIVVTKFHPVSLVRNLYELGVRDFGENRHQDAAPKAAALADLDLTWHFVGQLQSKKARAVIEYSRVIHSVDRTSLVRALALTVDPAQPTGDAPRPIDIFIQLNLTDDANRGGVAPAQLEALAEGALGTPCLRLRGLMAVAPVNGDPRAAFAEVRAASARLQRLAPDATALSMGMSADYREAILDGATHLRIGSAITGNRPDAG
ncbi:YggS family pyridoxal phosphate-dependent enzyme [Glaciihabitans tibetensis]|uniref:YggS family pyridoxal phosphate-dependent enzyme n=1 Tax=Glaciihabitans tibetensis TaxID=1266600 RepID=UPI000D06B5CC|nr:YggS family pyridoxal phosphate-dependent enzyme [Glaciihabitans tibetensis]